ncbi:MAG: hypothetical protein D4R63_03695 [Methylococcaceae bacterium]|nr:MAG: hypothetical protein D4R63_03695 [Methylococcaceae bacterium]
MKVLITGDSHTGILKTALDSMHHHALLPDTIDFSIRPLMGGDRLSQPFFIDQGTHALISSDYGASWIKQLPIAEDEGFFNYYGISGPLHTVRLWRQGPFWKKHTPLLPSHGAVPLSTAFLRHIVKQDQQYLMQLIALLQRNNTQIFVIEAPRPFVHNPALKVIDIDIIIYIDQLYRATLRSWLTERGIAIVNVPAQCIDSEGFMLSAYRHDNPNDPHHGNQAFGEIMMKEIIRYLQQLPTPHLI